MLILFQLVFILLGVAFYTLFERKLLSLSQSRIGPNQTIIWGVLQPVLDGGKLLLKKMSTPKKSFFLFFVIPALSFMSMVLLWMSIPSFLHSSFLYSLLFFLLLVGFMVYSHLLMGWSSFSKYGMIGSVRGGAQSVSYEVLLTLVVVGIILFSGSFIISSNMLLWSVPLFFLWGLSSLAECNRAPIDFSEGESELISGFNVEYGSSGFVLLFLSEYGMMILFSLMSDVFFFHLKGGGIMVLVFFILSRSVLPRYRYDKFMSLMWKISLPLICFLLVLLLLLT